MNCFSSIISSGSCASRLQVQVLLHFPILPPFVQTVPGGSHSSFGPTSLSLQTFPIVPVMHWQVSVHHPACPPTAQDPIWKFGGSHISMSPKSLVLRTKSRSKRSDPFFCNFRREI